MNELPFIKMHGLGNDFVIIDARSGKPAAGIMFSAAQAAAIADRRTGVGCDQLITIEDTPRKDSGGHAFIRIRNADGGEVNACGNATRCVGAMLLAETGEDQVGLLTGADLLTVKRAGYGLITVDMGTPLGEWNKIPLAVQADTLHLDLSCGPLSDPAAISMGNPHATFFVDQVSEIPIALVGPELENDPIFPERANIGISQILAPDRMKLRVWERGVGLTLACGTGACAAVVNANRRDLAGRRMVVEVDGGELLINWQEDRPGELGRVFMTGPAATSFCGILDQSLLT
ncbi:MAG: Diaminopimelate epimerase [Alphaproteobacteria bacterium MarineAlpha11_Bin1]|nr:MAG: Diaminopimelate epimerase [Alphaproteobacteria bacterium MarineAlpha11_Bin1]|tara:strand:+ start:813 stop:1679 length:867 start_codon:yes stop_codon:yes gene_type:complete